MGRCRYRLANSSTLHSTEITSKTPNASTHCTEIRGVVETGAGGSVDGSASFRPVASDCSKE